MIERVLSFVFGGGRNVLKETAEVFRENAEGRRSGRRMCRSRRCRGTQRSFARRIAGGLIG